MLFRGVNFAEWMGILVFTQSMPAGRVPSNMSQTTSDTNALAIEMQRRFDEPCNVEFAAIDSSTGDSFLFTVKTESLFCRPFLGVADELRNAVEDRPAFVSIGSNRYGVDTSYRSKLLGEVRAAKHSESRQLETRTITVQSRGSVCCYLGESDRLVRFVLSQLPDNLVPQSDTLRSVRHDVGRKVGRAAKDIALMRGNRITPQLLDEFELSGEEMAWKCVNKDAVIAKWSFDDLRNSIVAPMVALICWEARRRLLVRPARGRNFRKMYVLALSKLFHDLGSCSDRAEAVRLMFEIIADMGGLERKVLGTSFIRFAERMQYPCLQYPFHTWRDVEDSAPNDWDGAWNAAKDLIEKKKSAESLGKGQKRSNLPIPHRTLRRISGLRRVGPVVSIDSHEMLMDRYGYTGIELGKWVSTEDMHLLVGWIDRANADLVRLCGDWLVRLMRAGNLALAIGARGSGKASAHYESALKTINLTRTHSQGTLAHELAHFIDHQLGNGFLTEQKQPFLSGALLAGFTHRDPVVTAFRRVMDAIGLLPRWRKITGNPKPTRWYGRAYIKRMFEQHGGDVQRTFDRITGQGSADTGRRPRHESTYQIAADSIAKWTELPVRVRSFHKSETSYLREAKKLGEYWSRPHELFARAFESWVEDQLASGHQCNEYLVRDTVSDYGGFRGKPFPEGKERAAINRALSKLVEACQKRL